VEIYEEGAGSPLVLVPGAQGRWEYGRPTIGALATSFHVLTSSLCGEPGCGSLDTGRGLDDDVAQVAATLDSRGVDRAVVCGVSFGGLVALRFAARFPERTSALILASTPGPSWHLKPRHDVYAAWPRLFAPLFFVEATRRFRNELTATFAARRDRWAVVAFHMRTGLAAPVSVSLMARRGRLIPSLDPAGDARRVTAPTLVVTGEPELDYVVPVTGTSAYLQLIPNATHAVLMRTGHLGTVTRPHEFARLVREFVETSTRKIA
jgi:pimeloyl-ACP methyl ester carboxylesterase